MGLGGVMCINCIKTHQGIGQKEYKYYSDCIHGPSAKETHCALGLPPDTLKLRATRLNTLILKEPCKIN